MNAGTTTLVIIVSVLLGSIPFGLVVARLWTGADVRRIGSGNIGATNVVRASGPWAGALTLVLDAAKGGLAVLIALIVSHQGAGFPPAGENVVFAAGAGLAGLAPIVRPSIAEWAALAAVAGHMFSPWLGFQGGKGVATAAGALAVLSPGVFFVALGVFVVVFALSRIVSLSSIMASLVIPVLAATGLARTPSLPMAAVISGLIVLRHLPNLRRLRKGTESRFGARGKGSGHDPSGDGAAVKDASAGPMRGAGDRSAETRHE